MIAQKMARRVKRAGSRHHGARRKQLLPTVRGIVMFDSQPHLFILTLLTFLILLTIMSPVRAFVATQHSPSTSRDGRHEPMTSVPNASPRSTEGLSLALYPNGSSKRAGQTTSSMRR